MAGEVQTAGDANGFLTVEVPEQYVGMTVAEALRRMGFDIDLPCGGNGRCGKCTCPVKTGNDPNQEWKELRICQAKVSDERITVKLPEKMMLGSAETDVGETAERIGGGSDGKAFLAVDVGTTTVEAVLWQGGEIRAHFAVLNPQKKYGADVISRIAYSEKEGGLEQMTNDIRACIRSMVEKCRNDLPRVNISDVYVAGNTTMQHLFLGVSPAGMGKYPFTPDFTETKRVRGCDVGLDTCNVTLLPSADAFIGADVVAGAELFLAYSEKSAELFIDLGTNGEMVLKADGKYYATSSAAGPCFEGANISCGTGGIEGAISAFEDGERGMTLKTIGNRWPVGICGSGLLSLVAMLLEKEVIDETGAMDGDYEIGGWLGEEFVNTGLTLTRKDVREFQLAKAAIRTGIQLLLEKGGVRACEVSKVYTAGGLGTHIDPEAALKTGLFPPEFRGKFLSPGNTSLKGALRAGTDPAFIDAAGELALRFETFSLNDEKTFNERFVDNMYFD